MQTRIMRMNGIAVGVAGACLLFTAVAASADAEASKIAASTFAQRCAECHAADGSGATVMGKSANIPDLRSPQLLNQSDADLEDTIARGKGVMPAFGTSLSDDQINGLVVYVRGLAKKH